MSTYLHTPVQVLSDALGHAQHAGVFKNIGYTDRNWDNWRQLTSEDRKLLENSTIEDRPDLWIRKSRKPSLHEIAVIAFFPQMWGSTALGFGGVGGAAMTTAYTVVLECLDDYAVYFAGRFAYCVHSPNQKFMEDLANHSLAKVADSSKYTK